jgi:hypothetical protein
MFARRELFHALPENKARSSAAVVAGGVTLSEGSELSRWASADALFTQLFP